jgi:hypothetical protein
MWTLRIGMLQKVLSHRSYLFQGRRPMDLQALLVIASMIPFDVGMAIWALRRTHVGFDAQAEQEAAQGRWKVASGRATDPSGIAVKGEHSRQAILPQKVDNGLEGCFSMKILMCLRTEKDGSACIDKVEDFNHMLLFALWIGGNSAGVFEIYLDLF